MPEVQPKVSIVTPVYNRADVVRQTIDSITAQSYRNWELLLVDDGSTDDLESVVAPLTGDPRIRFVRRDRNPKGASTCRNIGAHLAAGDYLVFLDSDDMMESHCLAQRVAVMEANPELDLAVFPFRFVGPTGEYLANHFDNGRDPLINFLSYSSYWAIMCPIWRKRFFDGVGGFNELFPRYQDPEIHIRALTQPGARYALFTSMPPDTVVVPSQKSHSVQFARNLHGSLKLLVPQSCDALARAGKAHYAPYLRGYLTEWLRQFAHTNFHEEVAVLTVDVVRLFKEYGIIGPALQRLILAEVTGVRLLTKTLRYLYLKRLQCLKAPGGLSGSG